MTYVEQILLFTGNKSFQIVSLRTIKFENTTSNTPNMFASFGLHLPHWQHENPLHYISTITKLCHVSGDIITPGTIFQVVVTKGS